MADPSWPASFILDHDQANWNKWSYHLILLCKQHCLSKWLDPAFTPPDMSIDACSYCVYLLNDQSLMGFILCHISQLDYKAIHQLPTAHAIYTKLCQCYEKLGSHAQILLIEKVMKVNFCPGTHISQTWDEIDILIERIKAIGPLGYDQLKTAVAIKALGRHYENLQSTIQSITKQLNFLVNNIANCLLEEDNHICNHKAQGLLPVATALAAQATTPATRTLGNRMRPTYLHCKHTRHYTGFCI